jgi:hypothetical protein
MLGFVLKDVVDGPVGRHVVLIQVADSVEFVVRHRAQTVQNELSDSVQSQQVIGEW